MDHNLELIRDLLMVLEDRQVSPRTPIMLEIEDVADEISVVPDAVEDALDLLLDLGYIDGPGSDEPGFWLFRKLTRKGVQFVQATRRPADWKRLKRHFASRAWVSGL